MIPIKNRRRMNDNRQIKNFFIRHSNSLNSRHLLNMRQSVFPLSFFRLNILCCENLQATTLLLFSGLFMLSRMIFLLTSKKNTEVLHSWLFHTKKIQHAKNPSIQMLLFPCRPVPRFGIRNRQDRTISSDSII